MEKIRMVSLGALCRPAHQIGVYARSNPDVAGPKGPFDWTITSFASLQTCLHPDFDPASVLQPGHIVFSYAGSGMCAQTGVIFHHAMAPKIMKALGETPAGEKVPETQALAPLVQDSRSRFAHTYRSLLDLRGFPGHSVFVRYMKFGHPDPVYPETYAAETLANLNALLARFLGHERFHVLSVYTEKARRGVVAPLIAPVTRFEPDGRHIVCSIKERKGWNGNQKPNFKGDEHSWSAAFDRTMAHLSETGAI